MTSPFLDLQKVIENWAWDKYELNMTRKQKNLREKQKRKGQPYIGLKIDWSDVEFFDEPTNWSRLADVEEQNENEADDNDNKSKPKGATAGSPLKASVTTGSDVNILFQTEFTNNTKLPQMYSMKIDKTTRSTCSTEVEHGVTKGFEMGVSLKLPSEILEINAGYHQEVELTNTNGESFEEELHWGAESEITVEPKHVAQARLLVREKKQSGDFEIVTRIRGYVGVTFTNLRDNNSFLKRADGDISYVLKKFLDKQQQLGTVYPHVNVNEETDTVTVTTKGECKFRYGVRQEVKVDQTPIE